MSNTKKMLQEFRKKSLWEEVIAKDLVGAARWSWTLKVSEIQQAAKKKENHEQNLSRHLKKKKSVCSASRGPGSRSASWQQERIKPKRQGLP